MNSVVITSPAKATIQADLAKKAEVVFKRLGLSREQVIDLFLKNKFSQHFNERLHCLPPD